MANRVNGALYIGVTSDLYSRVVDHREGTYPGFTKRYGIRRLVYHESHDTMEEAIRRETQLKKWKRLWKIRLIEEVNPTWSDLFDVDDGIRECGCSGQDPGQTDR